MQTKSIRLGLFLTVFCCVALAIDTRLEAADAPVDTNEAVSLVPVQYRHQLVQQLSLAEDHREQWLACIAHCRPEQREALAFLLVNMPERDLKNLSAEFLLHNVEQAYTARAATRWATAIPNEIFLNEVLPYANLNEQRDDCREDFFKQFFPLVKDCKSAGEAAQVLNREVFKALNVSYHATKREKPDQSPYESKKIHYASCSGLSIILADACRAVGVPARLAGTPLWFNASGNHTWVEIWDGQWRYIGAAEPSEFNKTWFTDLAVKADDSKPINRIYAASFARTDQPFILVWDPSNTTYPGVDVTGYYVCRKHLKVNVLDKTGQRQSVRIEVRQGGRLIAAGTSGDEFELAADSDYSARAIAPNGHALEVKILLTRDADATVNLMDEKVDSK